VRIPAALQQFLPSARISVPGAIVGSMLAEWLVGFEGMGGILSGYKGQGNYGGVWTIVALVSIVLYELMTIVETALLARWGPDAGVSRRVVRRRSAGSRRGRRRRARPPPHRDQPGPGQPRDLVDDADAARRQMLGKGPRLRRRRRSRGRRRRCRGRDVDRALGGEAATVATGSVGT